MASFSATITTSLLLFFMANLTFALSLPRTPSKITERGFELSLIAVGGNQGLWNTGPETDSVDIITLATNSHKAGAVMPQGNSKFGSVLGNDTVYVVGGDYRDTFWAYSVPENTWTQMPDFPVAVSGSQLVEVNGTLLAIGGATAQGHGRNDEINQIFGYDLSTGKNGEWVGVSNMPDNERIHDFPCAVSLKGIVYYINQDQIYSSSDLGATWSFMSTGLPISVYLHACVAVGDDTIWVIGGHDYGGELLSEIQVFNTSSNTVMPRPVKEMPKRRQGHAAVVLPDSGDVLVCGGVQVQEAFDDCVSYSTKDKKWTASKYVLDKPRAQFGLVVANIPAERTTNKLSISDD